MAKRQCLECGGELVMSFHPSENGRTGLVPSSAAWRCGTCGHSYTAEQLRQTKRMKSKVVEPAE
jgi:ribosomal protein S27AE